MFAKLISLLLHAKAGVISGVFLLGATGALVSVSASNGVTTITITETSPSPSPAASPVTSPTTSPTASPSPAASPALSSPATSQACVDEAAALAFQVQRVNTAFTGFHTDLMKLRGERDATTVEKADELLRAIRQSATKAIHATATVSCVKKDDDEDENDNDEDKDKENDDDKSLVTQSAVTLLSFVEDANSDEDHDGGDHKPVITFTGDATAIADQAIAAMQTAFDTAKNAPVKTPKASPTHKDESANGSDHKDGKGDDHKGEHRD